MASPGYGRELARKLYPLTNCAACGAPGFDRHHRDGNTFNNAPSNVVVLCRRCHMTEDGRLEAFTELGRAKKPQLKRPEIACRNCGAVTKAQSGRQRGRCHACDMFFRRNGTERVVGPHGRAPMPRKYSDAQISEALEIYTERGAESAAAFLGSSYGFIYRALRREGRPAVFRRKSCS